MKKQLPSASFFPAGLEKGGRCAAYEKKEATTRESRGQAREREKLDEFVPLRRLNNKAK
jgi:hypothetical protein